MSPTPSTVKRTKRMPVVPSRTMSQAAALAALDRHKGLRRHPSRVHGTKYMTAFLVGSALIATETTGASYASFWVEAAAIAGSRGDLADLAMTHYGPGEPRISSLKTYGPIGTAAAVRVVPRDAQDVHRLVDALRGRAVEA